MLNGRIGDLLTCFTQQDFQPRCPDTFSHIQADITHTHTQVTEVYMCDAEVEKYTHVYMGLLTEKAQPLLNIWT